jgi:phytoene dehydrogenase-like protein
VAALVLAKAGERVLVLERADAIGGATRTEYPFARAPNLPQSTGAYLLGLMPPELERLLGVEIPTLRRDPHYFLPTTGERHLLFGSDRAAFERDPVASSRNVIFALSVRSKKSSGDFVKTWARRGSTIH